MQRNILYDRSTSLPSIRGHFLRPRMEKLLAEALDRHFIVITAGAGWGKTQAVSSFMHHSGIRFVWMQLSKLDNYIVRFWENFTHALGLQNPALAFRLAAFGFPDSTTLFHNFLHLFVDSTTNVDKLTLIFDDVHLINDPSILHFIENLLLARLKNLTIILIGRAMPDLDLHGLYTDGTCQITEEDLRFTKKEAKDYFAEQGIILPEKTFEEIYTETDGWISALYLISLSLKQSNNKQNLLTIAKRKIFELIEQEIFLKYSAETRHKLIEWAVFDRIPAGFIKKYSKSNSDLMSELEKSNLFVRFNPVTETYDIHHLFLEFLIMKQIYLTEQEMGEAYLKAADWCADNEQKLDALAYYDKCGRYDKIWNIMLHYGVATFPKSTADFFLDLIDTFPKEFIRRNPMIHVIHAGLLLNNADIPPAIRELLETQKELEAFPSTEDAKTVLGEIYNMLGLLSLGSCNYDFKDLFRKASECLPNGSIIDNNGKPINTKYAIMLSSPAPGELKKMEEALHYAMPYASKVMHGYGYGLDYLASAEAAYFTGDMKTAAKNAYEAIYRARERQVSDIASSGYFLLMRIEASNGSYKGVVSHLEQLRTYVQALEDKLNFNGMLDIAEGWFKITVGRTEGIADWIIDDTLRDVLAPYSIGMERLIKAKYLLRNGRYHELLAWLGQSEGVLRQGNMWLILLDTLIYKAVAFHHIHDDAQTIAALQKAYEIAHGNNLIMQFAEFGSDMRAVIYNVKRSELNSIPDAWLDEIYTKASTYEKHLNNVKSQYRQSLGQISKPAIRLTKKEREMVRYLCQGLTNQEIANTLYISVSGVKKSLNNIYTKLGATNRADAVRIAIQMELQK